MGVRRLGLNVRGELRCDLNISRGKSWAEAELCLLVRSPELHFWVREAGSGLMWETSRGAICLWWKTDSLARPYVFPTEEFQQRLAGLRRSFYWGKNFISSQTVFIRFPQTSKSMKKKTKMVYNLPRRKRLQVKNKSIKNFKFYSVNFKLLGAMEVVMFSWSQIMGGFEYLVPKSRFYSNGLKWLLGF